MTLATDGTRRAAMGGPQVFMVCAAIFTAVSGSHMQGGTISFKATEKTHAGWLVDFKYKSAFINGYPESFYWGCFTGDCGYQMSHWIEPVDNRTQNPRPWYQYEGLIKRRVDNDKPFQLLESGCCWVSSTLYEGGWQLTTSVDLGIRSDTKLPNSSPVTSIIPILRIPENCETTINIFGHDPDGDVVSCRYGYLSGECSFCSWNFNIDNKQCKLFAYPWMNPGSYLVELILEDFPKSDIYLRYNDGTITYKNRPYNRKSRELPKDSQKYYWYGTTLAEMDATIYEESLWTTESVTDIVTFYPDTMETTETVNDFPGRTTSVFAETTQYDFTEAVTIPYQTTEWDFYPSSSSPTNMDSLSSISLQFLVEVTSASPSCTFGDYRPKFISPTPHQGEKLLANAGKVFQLHLSAQAAYERISDFKVSGPPGIMKALKSEPNSSTRSMVVKWTPSKNNVGDHVPFCFVAETLNGYQSEMRCVIAVVGPSSLDNVELICHENTMTLIVTKSSDQELYENQFRLNDPQCLVSSNSTHLVASVAYNSCGTETEETEHDIVFKNQATSFGNTSSIITRENGVSIPFNCSFPKKSRVSASFRAHKADYVFAEAGFGNFTYKFQFYTDDRFAELETQYPVEVALREILYMEIQVSSSVPNVQLFVESCKATPHDNPNDPTFYDIIQNGCIKDETVVVYSTLQTQYRFAMEAFAFIGDYTEVYMSCTVILCKFGDPGTRCTQGCVRKSLGDSSRLRHRRSLTSESQQHFISQGPLRMKRQSPSNVDQGASSSLNVNTLVISLSGVVIFGLLGFIIHMYAKRVRLPGYESLKTQDF